MTLKLKSIEEEAADCRAAFEDFPVGGFVLHCHHEELAERLNEPVENRIEYILKCKEPEEQALRLRLFRPIPEEILKSHPQAYTDYRKAYAKWLKACEDREKAFADREKAYVEWQKAGADCLKAREDREKAGVVHEKAYARCRKVYVEWRRACVILGNLVHDELCHDCPWDGRTIFPR